MTEPRKKAPKVLPTLNRRGSPLSSPTTQREMLRRLPLAREFATALENSNLWPLTVTKTAIFQVNVGKVCNQTCRHCHVDAGPDRRESMSRETFELCLAALAETDIPTVDITGGAPEMNPHFRWFVGEVKKLGRHVIDRCNLTILHTKAHADLPDFFAEHDVEVVCSLPHYRPLNTDKQRGDGVFEKSIEAIRWLNERGYGSGRDDRRLVLVTNPAGAFLPAKQCALEPEWKGELARRYGVRFDSLFTITNMPISRYLEWLDETKNLERYLDKLVRAYNPLAAAGVMCRDTLSVGWDGTLYDCDFNQMLDMPVRGEVRHIRDFDLAKLEAREIAVDRHCFGCTAGEGSSCGGATA